MGNAELALGGPRGETRTDTDRRYGWVNRVDGGHRSYRSCGPGVVSVITWVFPSTQRLHPSRYAVRTYLLASGRLVTSSFSASHSIFVPMRLATLPRRQVSVNGPA